MADSEENKPILRPQLAPAISALFESTLVPGGNTPLPRDLADSWGGIVFGIRLKPASCWQHLDVLRGYPMAVRCHLYLYTVSDKGKLDCTQWFFDESGRLSSIQNTLVVYQKERDLTFTLCKLPFTRSQAEILTECLTALTYPRERQSWVMETFSCCQSSRERRAKEELLATLKGRLFRRRVSGTSLNLPGDEKIFTLTGSDDEDDEDEKKTDSSKERVDVRIPSQTATRFTSVQPWTSQELIATFLLATEALPPEDMSLAVAHRLRVDELLDLCCLAHHPVHASVEFCAKCTSAREGSQILEWAPSKQH